MKSKEKLDSLTKFLTEHPELRFWQGLLAWAKSYYGNQWEEIETIFVNATDTFYWE